MRLGLLAGRPILACSRLSRFAFWQSNDVSGVFPTHRGGDYRRSDRVDRLPSWKVSAVSDCLSLSCAERNDVGFFQPVERCGDPFGYAVSSSNQCGIGATDVMSRRHASISSSSELLRPSSSRVIAQVLWRRAPDRGYPFRHFAEGSVPVGAAVPVLVPMFNHRKHAFPPPARAGARYGGAD